MAVLKLLGFDSGGAAQLVVVEAMLTSTLAAAGGAVLAWLIIGRSGVVISVEGFTIAPTLSPEVMALATCAGLLLGALGAWWPALSGARLPIVQALREVD
jgi:ABC-type antimicrobial peptide transport system permease subunit